MITLVLVLKILANIFLEDKMKNLKVNGNSSNIMSERLLLNAVKN